MTIPTFEQVVFVPGNPLGGWPTMEARWGKFQTGQSGTDEDDAKRRAYEQLIEDIKRAQS